MYRHVCLLQVQALVMGGRITLFEHTADLCAHTSCPMLPGQPAILTMSGSRGELGIDLLGRYKVRLEVAVPYHDS